MLKPSEKKPILTHAGPTYGEVLGASEDPENSRVLNELLRMPIQNSGPFIAAWWKDHEATIRALEAAGDPTVLEMRDTYIRAGEIDEHVLRCFLLVRARVEDVEGESEKTRGTSGVRRSEMFDYHSATAPQRLAYLDAWGLATCGVRATFCVPDDLEHLRNAFVAGKREAEAMIKRRPN